MYSNSQDLIDNTNIEGTNNFIVYNTNLRLLIPVVFQVVPID